MSLSKLYNLPLIPIELILQQLSIGDLLRFSLVSSECQQMVHDILKMVFIRWRFVQEFTDNEESHISRGIKVFTQNYDWMKVEVAGLKEEEWLEKKEESGMMVDIGGVKVIIEENDENVNVFMKKSAGDMGIRKVMEHLENTFDSENNDLKISLNGIGIEWQDTIQRRNFENIEVEEPRRFSLGYNAMYLLTMDDLEMYLENVNIETRVRIGRRVEKCVEWKKHFKHSKLNIHYAEWITIDCLLGMKCRKLSVRRHNLTVSDLETFIEDWMKGGYKQLEIVKLRDSRDNMIPLFNGSIPFQNRSTTQFYGDHNLGGGSEIRRSDGRVATVLCTDHHFYFYVWPEGDP